MPQIKFSVSLADVMEVLRRLHKEHEELLKHNSRMETGAAYIAKKLVEQWDTSVARAFVEKESQSSVESSKDEAKDQIEEKEWQQP
jgi:hypothetical protein